ncbi:uncharacterized protein LOC124151241 isoform X2 [Haliotis rufescens]|uniref:uncharacterized protein LOC124151241 isoform X2 n=1 Tax=Haliotis rufescens TaxID=6454 RepID=UPI00201F54F3|nr:uncharacterized protein LOC124151241 isoform X2 [Haliotis rufescens]
MHAAMTHKTNKISLLVLIWTCYTVGDGQVVSYEVDESHATLPVLTWWESTGKYPDYVISCETQQRCLVSRNKTRLQHQEVMMYVFYGSFFLSSALPFPRKDGDIWALIHEESPMNKDWLFSFRSTIELFNYTSTFKRGSDYPLTTHWLTNKETLLSKEYLVPTDRKNVMRTDGGLAPIIFVHSDCNTPSNREQYVKTLQKYVDVDSYGPCLHNKDFPEEFKNLDGIAGFLKPDFLRFVARYKFAMAFENAICGDYITEKLWRPLQVGTVPIVLGSPTIRMATSQIEKVSEFLTCVICQELYTDPCTLRCDHTFCRKCVTGYIQTRPDAVQSKTIPCAFCRQDTKVPHPSRPVEEWAGQIKPSIIIQGLIDTQGDVIKTGSASCCSVCEKLGETTPGASWCSECQVSLCERCVKIHRASPASHDHEICDLSGEVKVKRRRKFICREHKDEVIKLVCKDCHKAVCQTCYVVYHRKCESVVTIQAMLPNLKYHLRRHAKQLSKKVHRKETIVKKTDEKISGIEKNKIAVENHIKSAVERAIANIKQKEKQLMKEFKDITDKQTEELKADVKLEEIEIQMYRQHCEFIDQALASDCEMDLYDAYQAWESGAVELGDVRDTDTADTRRIDDIRFTPDTDNVQHILDDLQLGKIDVTYQDQGTCLPSPVLIDVIDGEMAGDEAEPALRDITVLVVNGIQTVVVTDFNNKCVKSFYIGKNQPCHSKLPLDNSPRGLTQLKENQVMVAVPEFSEIVTVEVTPDLVLLSTITTSMDYYSLAVLSPSSLAAGTWNCVDILDMAGHVLRSVTTHNNETLFAPLFYMCVNNKGNILVSDRGEQSVTCVTSEGHVVWRYAPTGDRALSDPYGISTTTTGDILVADSNKVIRLTETGGYVTDHQDIGCDPYGLYVDRHDTLYVCGRGQIHEINFM